jgi:methylthioribulose 1-phosphate dehydratase / enolase-phosphatase E1
MQQQQNSLHRFESVQAVGVDRSEHPLTLIPELCKQFYSMGWCTGTGGGLSIRDGDDVYIAPSGIQKERIRSESIYVFDMKMNIKFSQPNACLRPSACTPLFFNAFKLRNAGAVFHSHAAEVAMITLLFPGREFRISRLEMIKGIKGYGYEDTLVIPIIENTPHEAELTDTMYQAMVDYPNCSAILVRRHGIYIWGDTWQEAKSQAECYHYLFNFVLEAKKLGIDLAPRYPTPRCILLDIEGTTTSISFVKDVLFPIARKSIREYVLQHQNEERIQSEYAKVKQTLEEEGGKCDNVNDAIDALEKWIDQDRKHPSLKYIQGLIWEQSYTNGTVKGHLYDDVPKKLTEWKERGFQIAIYSSGSVQAQKLLFGHSTFGDLTPYISHYFDTAVGQKRDVKSYHAISSALNIAASDILFLSDISDELDAAQQAGYQVAQLFRDEIPRYLYNYRFQVLTNFKELSL